MPNKQTTLLDRNGSQAEFSEPERFTLIDVVNASIRVNQAGRQGGRVLFVRQYHALPTIWSDRRKVLQILTSNMDAAVNSLAPFERREVKLTIRVETRLDQACVEIEFDGPAFGGETLAQLSGLQNSAALAKELGGKLTFNRGAGGRTSFHLALPCRQERGEHA
jgi:C4-dicarboxylate-specific signal transduction histidine kinase